MQRNTLQRQIILDAVIKLNNHPSIEEVYIEVKKDYPAISKTTIYRNLRQLAQNRILGQVSLPDGLERYDTRTTQHHHFKCRNCDKIFDVDMDYPVEINNAIKMKYGYQVDEHNIVFKGICAECGKIRKK